MKCTPLQVAWIVVPLLAMAAGCHDSPNRFEAVNNGQGGVNIVRVPNTPQEPVAPTSQPSSQVQQLEARVQELEAENAQLRRNAATAPSP